MTGRSPGSTARIDTGFAEDPALPARDLALDEGAMSVVLGAALDLVDPVARIRRTKYRIGESLRVLYEVTGTGTAPILVSLRCFAERADGQRIAAGDGSLLLPELRAEGWVFPSDRRLGSLASFWADPAARERALGRSADRVELMAYAPEKAATFRCADGDEVFGYAKLHQGDGHRRSAAMYRAIGPKLEGAGLDTVRVLAVDDELGLVLLSPAEGTPLATRHSAIDWYRLGTAIARLHQLAPPPWLEPFERLSLDRARTAADLIGRARPDVASLADHLVDHLETAWPGVEPEPDTVLHGDVHPKNVLASANRVVLIDLDQAGTGAPAAELGSALAALRHSARHSNGDGHRRGHRSPFEASPFERHLLEGYSSIRPLPSPAALTWHVAAALLEERVLRAVNRVRVDHLPHLADTLAEAVHILQNNRVGVTP